MWGVCVFFLLHFTSVLQMHMLPEEHFTVFNNFHCAHAAGNEMLTLLKSILIYLRIYLFLCVQQSEDSCGRQFLSSLVRAPGLRGVYPLISLFPYRGATQ